MVLYFDSTIISDKIKYYLTKRDVFCGLDIAFSMQIYYELFLKEHLPRIQQSQSLERNRLEHHDARSSKLFEIVQVSLFLLTGGCLLDLFVWSNMTTTLCHWVATLGVGSHPQSAELYIYFQYSFFIEVYFLKVWIHIYIDIFTFLYLYACIHVNL